MVSGISPGGLLSMGTGGSTGAGLSFAQVVEDEEAALGVTGFEVAAPLVLPGDWVAVDEVFVQPTKTMLASRQASAKSGFSDRKP